ncbi:MAG: hypothetical protein LKF48_01380 [Prevotella sp.]|nr:hypothetical protein [Prevotella sp.]MCH4181805.1 hypothetical protein [Prevotella sp.]MCH4212027.1 hypothetical protein [Prevotella sp.]
MKVAVTCRLFAHCRQLLPVSMLLNEISMASSVVSIDSAWIERKRLSNSGKVSIVHTAFYRN